MEEDKQIFEAAKALGIGDLIPEVYRDMLQPAAQQLGDGLATIAKAVKISLAPLEAGVWGYEKIKEWLSYRVTRILADRKVKNILPPPLSIAGPLVFQLIFAKDEPELKELYASLLSSSMDPIESYAHPSFVSIIQQLTSDEAKVLRFIVDIGEKWPALSEDPDAEGTATDSIRLQFNDWCERASVTNIDRSDAYLDNLVRLRIFKMDIRNEAQFEPAGGNRYGTYNASVSNLEYAFVELTTFGRLFLDACIEKKKEPNE